MAYITTTQAKVRLGVSSTADDATIGMLIDEAQSWFERETGRVFAGVQETRYYNALADVDDEHQRLWLDRDLIQCTTVRMIAVSTLADSQYILEPANYTPKYSIKIRTDSTQGWDFDDYPEQSIAITGTWGYSTGAPADVRLCMYELVNYLYHERETRIFDVTIVPGQYISVPQGFPARALRTATYYRKTGLR